jgi:lipid-binding SYLF domain-containing protein
MKPARLTFTAASLAITAVFGALTIPAAQARTPGEIEQQGRTTLERLNAEVPGSRIFADHAKAVLVFPEIFKAGLVFGGESGNGVLFINGHRAGFYNISGGSWGLQIGAQKFSYVLYFMNTSSLRYLHKSDGWSAGTGPSIVVINKGAAAEADTTTISKDVYAFPFGSKGLMADLTLQGTKISRIHPH